MHLGPAGHQRMAIAVLDALGVAARPGAAAAAPSDPALSGRERRASQRSSGRARTPRPWVHRRLTGRSSGDGISPKRPMLGPI